MISKQDFLKIVEKEVFPHLLPYHRKVKWISILSIKGHPLLSLFLPSSILCCSSIIIFDNSILTFIFVLLSIGLPILLLFCLMRLGYKINKIIIPKISSALNLIEQGEGNKEYSFLEKLSHYGFLPVFEDSVISSSDILKESYYNLLVQTVGLGIEKNEESVSVFYGILVSSRKFQLFNSSLLMLDKTFKHNRKQQELISRYPTKSLGEGKYWEVISCGDSWLNSEYMIYGMNIKSDKILASAFIDVIKKLKSLYPVPINILINKEGTFLAIETGRDLFDLSDKSSRGLINIKPYEEFYDRVETLNQLDDIFKNLENSF